MKSLEMKRRYYKRKKAEIWKKISKIAEENNVPNWMARLYYYYERETEAFLFFRELRSKESFKNEIKKYLNGNKEIETTNIISWKELYEILGEEATNKLSISDMFDTMKAILEKIRSLAIKNEPIPYEFEGEVLSQCYMHESNFPIIADSIKRYLLTELPTGTEICLELFTKTEKGPLEVKYIGGGCTHQFDYHYDDEVKLYIKVKFSYSN